MTAPIIEFSDSHAAIAKALFVMQSNMGDLTTNASNPAFKSKYADLGAVVEAVSPALEKAKLTVLQGASGEVLPDGSYVTIVETMLLHESGEWVRCRLPIKPSKQDPQGAGSAITYGRRYGLQSLCGLAPEDDDGNKASQRTQGQGNGQSAQPAAKSATIDAQKKALFNALTSRLPAAEVEAIVVRAQEHYGSLPTGKVEDLHDGDEARDAYGLLQKAVKNLTGAPTA